MANYFLYSIIGAIAGLNSACWGAYKDSLYEKFKTWKYARSIIFGFLSGILAFELLKIVGVYSPNLGVLFVFIVSIERSLTEFAEAFVCKERRGQYRIPSKFHILGRIVENRFRRLFIGFSLICLAFLFFFLPSLVKINAPSVLNGFIWGIIAGTAGSAFWGAWKDAPIEGFDFVKFFRSPVTAGLWGIVLSFFTSNYSLLLFACIGAERMTVEFYKTFITRQVPGKFKATEPVYKNWTKKRHEFILPYAITWIIFIVLLFN